MTGWLRRVVFYTAVFAVIVLILSASFFLFASLVSRDLRSKVETDVRTRPARFVRVSADVVGATATAFVIIDAVSAKCYLVVSTVEAVSTPIDVACGVK